MKLKLKRTGPNKRYRFKGYKTIKQAARTRMFERQRQLLYQYIFLIILVIAVVVACIVLKPWDKIRDILTVLGIL